MFAALQGLSLSRQIMPGRNKGRIYLLRLFEGSRALDTITIKLPREH